MFRVQQFAQLAHVTVRTLHHYDRVGRLSPALRSEKGYRLYRMEDLVQLERILVLRYLGLPLRSIAEVLTSGSPAPEHTLLQTLSRQAAVLRERRQGIDRVLRAIEQAQQQLHTDKEPDWSLYQIILKEIHMQESKDWTKTYCTEEAQQAIEQRQQQWSPEQQMEVTANWQRMFADVQSALDRSVPPTSAEGKDLARRWMELVGGFTGGDPEVLKGLNAMYADRANWPADKQGLEFERGLPKPELMAFIRAAQAKS
jgi:DNA-binding transcriptional MerR regulator